MLWIYLSCHHCSILKAVKLIILKKLVRTKDITHDQFVIYHFHPLPNAKEPTGVCWMAPVSYGYTRTQSFAKLNWWRHPVLSMVFTWVKPRQLDLRELHLVDLTTFDDN
jgi:hypothetical protein